MPIDKLGFILYNEHGLRKNPKTIGYILKLVGTFILGYNLLNVNNLLDFFLSSY